MKPTTTITTTPASTAHLLAHADVVRGIEGTLLHHGVDRQDLADGVGEVQVRALAATRGKAQPADVGQWRALCCTVAARWARTEHRRALRRSRWDHGLPKDPHEEHPPLAPSPGKVREALDVRRDLDAVRARFEAGDMPEHGAAILGAVVDGHSAKEIGAELGLTETAVKKRVGRIRARLEKVARSTRRATGEEG